MFCNEIVLRLMFRRIGLFGRLSLSAALLTAPCVHTVNTALYAVPAIYLASDPSLALKLTGLLYVMGIVVYIINSWSCIPVFIYATLLPAIGMMTFALLQSVQGVPERSPMTHWGIIVGMLFLFIYACIDTMRQHLSTQMSLFDARRPFVTHGRSPPAGSPDQFTEPQRLRHVVACHA